MRHSRPASEAVTTEGDSAPGRLPPSDVYHVLRNERRRTVLRHLAEQDDSVEVGDLAEHVAAVEVGCPPGEVPADARRRVYISLHQTHLGTLADYGVLGHERGTVTAGPALAQFEPHLFDERRFPWGQLARFGGLGWVGGSLVTVTTVRYLPPSTVAVLSVLVGVAVALATRLPRSTTTDPDE